MTRAATADQIADRERDYRRHSMTNREIIAELDRIEREMREAAAKSQAATQEAMRVIEQLMNELGIPMAKDRADA